MHFACCFVTVLLCIILCVVILLFGFDVLLGRFVLGSFLDLRGCYSFVTFVFLVQAQDIFCKLFCTLHFIFMLVQIYSHPCWCILMGSCQTNS